MKSKMKSTFAIIAVALMVLVAVVPMVGVFTSDSDAAVKSEPSDAKDTSFTVTVKLYDASKTAIPTDVVGAEGYYTIQAAHGKYVWNQRITNAADGTTFTIYESSVDKLTITYVDDKKNEIKDYPKVELTKLQAGKSYTADLIAGHVQSTASFTFEDADDKITKDMIGDSSIEISYKLYELDGTTYKEIKGEGGKFVLSYNDDDELIGTYSYPVVTAGKYIAITSCTFKPASFDKTNYVDLGEDLEFSAVETLLIVKSNKVVNFPLTVALEGKKGTGDSPSSLTFNKIKGTFAEKANDWAYFSVNDTATGTYSGLKMTVSYNNKSDVVTEGLTDLDDLKNYTVKNAFYGKVTMNTNYIQDGTLTGEIAKSTAQSTPYSFSVKTVNGYFFEFVGGNDIATGNAITKIELDSTFEGNNTTITLTSNTDITLAYANYSVVSGDMYLEKFYNDAEKDVLIGSKELKVDGATTFGPLKTTAAGHFAFMAETGKNIVMSIDGAALSGDVSVVVGSGDEGADSKNLKVIMDTQKYTVKVQDALGVSLSTGVTVKFYDKEKDGTEIEQTKAGAQYDSKTKTWSGEIRGDETLTNLYAEVACATYTFAIVKYSDSAIKAKEATYKFGFYSPTGELLNVAAANVDVYVSKVFKNSAGALIFTQVGEAIVPAGPGTDGLLSVKTESKYVTVKESDIGTSETTVYAIYPKDTMNTFGIFKDVYLFSVNDKGMYSIEAAYDSYSATLTRIDKTTPIAGIKVELTLNNSFAAADVIDTAYTQADGSFTLYSKAAIDDEAGTKIKFYPDNGYTFDDSNNVYTNHVENELFTAKTDAYKFVFTDADGALIDLVTLGDTVTTKINNADVAASYAWKAGQKVDVKMTYTAGGALYRTFDTYTLTADDAASGVVNIESEQSTYAISVVDANGIPVDAEAFTFKAEYDGASYGAIPGTDKIPAMVATPVGGLFTGLYTFVCTDLLNDELVKAKITGFGVVTTLVGYGLKATDEPVAIEDESTVVTAPYGMIIYALTDASGAALQKAPAEVTKAYKNGVEFAAGAVLTATTLTFINDPEADYAFSLADSDVVTFNTVNYKYTFAPMQEPEDGVLVANEQWIIGDIVDAAGNVIGEANVVITAYDIYGGEYKTAKYVTDTYVAQGGMFYKMLADVSEIAAFKVADGAIAGYTFDYTDSPIIAANEMPVEFSAITANGCDVEGAAFEGPKAYNSYGKLIGTANGTEGVIVDVDEVAYFKVTNVVVDWDILGELNFNKESSTGVFVANESYLTGVVPYSGKANANQEVEFDFYLGDKLISYETFDIEGYEYEVLLDVSGMVTNGVAFDSLVAVYYENGVILGTAAVDPSTPINNIISPIIEIYVATLLPSSAIIANHVGIEQSGDLVTVTADGNFFVADDEGIYTDGQYKYVFAGWYVNNEKVSTSPVFTFELTDDVVISPQYTVTYEKTSDVNKDVEKEFVNIVDEVEVPVEKTVGVDTNVLIIGICAVIVALIAVVYAVIKKE